MTHVATAGTSSCATIAIGNFKAGQKELNEQYKADPEGFKIPVGMTVGEFYTKVLYPTTQPLGKSVDLPFELLMKHVDAGPLKTKFTTIVLNHTQFMQDKNYWPTELERWQFKLLAKTKNAIGGAVNYVFARNLAAVED
jgi:hypothetical protein